MKDRNDRSRQAAKNAEERHEDMGEDPETPLPDPQGDGEPAPADVQERVAAAAGQAVSTSGDPAQELAEMRDRFLRLAAEFDNFRKRSARERAESGTRAQAELVSRLADALDDLSRFAHIDPAGTDAVTLHKGIELVEQKMLKVLSAAGLEILNPLDQTFDPTQHEAVTTEPALSREDDHTVGKVFQRGYRFNGQLLRPARVVVKQWNG